MRHTSGRKHSTLAPEHAPVKTGNYSPTAAAMAIKLVGEKVYEMKKKREKQRGRGVRHNNQIKFNNFLMKDVKYLICIFPVYSILTLLLLLLSDNRVYGN